MESTKSKRWPKEYDCRNLACERCYTIGNMDDEKFNAILMAYFDKGLSIKDISDIFCLSEPVVGLLVAEPTAFEWDMYDIKQHITHQEEDEPPEQN